MSEFIDHRKAFISLFMETARYHQRYRVFEDLIRCSAIALHNGIRFDQELEDKYLKIVGCYDKKDVDRFVLLYSHIVMGLEQRADDFLGSVFMELELGNHYQGQYFTPIDISRMMAKIALSDMQEKLQSQSFITLSGPACGAGCMIIACAEEMKALGYNPQEQLWVMAQDISPIAVDMTYIQLSLLHIPAAVVLGNSLACEQRRGYSGDTSSLSVTSCRRPV